MNERKEGAAKTHDPRENLYAIGEVSKICNVSKKALRFYDKIGLIAPDYISEENGYRYYSRQTLLFVPVIKYYKQMGFKLEEMRMLMESNSYDFHAEKLRDKIVDLRRQREKINAAYTSAIDWYNLIREAEGVLDNNVTEVCVKYIEPLTACYMEQNFTANYMDAVINIEWTNYLESIAHEISGAVYLYFPHYREKLDGSPTKSVIFQKGIGAVEEGKSRSFGGQMMLSAYHIGAHEKVGETYKKIEEWAERHGYHTGEGAIERYVTDYWTSKRSEDFVMEILIEIAKK